MFKQYWIILFSACCLTFFSFSAEARTNVNLDISLNATPPAPPSQVVMMPPEGYNNCYLTQGMWEGNVWVPPHQECEYAGPSGPALWVSGYWGCIAIGPGGRCGHWRWYGHRWAGRPHMRYNYGYNQPHHHHRW